MPEQALALLARGLQNRLGDGFLSLYLYGSAAMGDFRPGWSDLDLLCLTRAPLSPAEAETLLPLRRTLAEENPAVPFLRCAEGAVLSLEECRSDCGRAVVWGSRGERLSNDWSPDAFTLMSLHQCGRLLAGEEVRGCLPCPDAALLRAAVAAHLTIIRRHAVITGDSVHSCGWLLDIARGLYTLRTGALIAKTDAGEWALAENLCPDADTLRRALDFRRNPSLARLPEARAFLTGPAVQRFADVLEAALDAPSPEGRILCRASRAQGRKGV
ncbi:MAG: aminoglycoside adenylyltransferase domain-containing protein [Aristaeellaceae bacterium]